MRAEKARLRERFRAARLALSPLDRAHASAEIVARVRALPEWAAARTVGLYWPLASRGEVDVRPLQAAARASGRAVAFPAVLSSAPPALAFRRVERDGDLVAGRWGLREPAPSAPHVEPGALDLVVVPAFGAGRDGGRIGHGGGFYDAFLPRTGAARVGVVYASCLVDTLPAENHDARLDVVVTEHEVTRIARNQGGATP